MRGDYSYWARYLERARNGYDRPLTKTTRVHWAGYGEGKSDAIAIKLHNTDIITFHADGRITLAHNGWTTVTTLARMREFSPAKIDTNGGDWLIPFEHDPNDPEPPAADRTILKPFHAADPGPEPVDDGVGCRVGEVEEYEVQDDVTVYSFDRQRLLECRGFPVRGSDYNREEGHTTLRLTRMHATEVIGANLGYYEHQEVRERGREPKKCEHCVAFEKLHAQWDHAMNGARWGRGEERGYRQMCEHLEEFGTREAWQEAYITEFREVREARRELKAWRERNMASFHDGIEVLSSGKVPLRHKREHVKALRRIERDRAKHNRMMKEHERLVRKRTAENEERRRVQKLMTAALAESIAVDLELQRPRWQEIKDKHRQEVS